LFSWKFIAVSEHRLIEVAAVQNRGECICTISAVGCKEQLVCSGIKKIVRVWQTCCVYIIIIILSLQPFVEPWPRFQFPNPTYGR
jgi:hypothetical protein